MIKKLKACVLGAGYFSTFHLNAWKRMEEVELLALCDRDLSKATEAAKKYGIKQIYNDPLEMFRNVDADFVDIITPPDTHLDLITTAAQNGLAIICQKPLVPNFSEVQKLQEILDQYPVPFMVHENFRFMPWHREVKKLLNAGRIGILRHIHQFGRMGDGWGEDAYLSRQPYFRDYKRLLIYETGIHFLDVFRFYAGEITEVYAKLRKHNPHIQGEDFAQMFLETENDVWINLDFGRYNESNASNPRLTFGSYTLEGTEGSIRIYTDGKITIQKLGKKEVYHSYTFQNIDFAGDCVYATQQHFIQKLVRGETDFETNLPSYIKNLEVQERIYDQTRSSKI